MLLIICRHSRVTTEFSAHETHETTPPCASAVFVCGCLRRSSETARASWGAHRVRKVSHKYISCPGASWEGSRWSSRYRPCSIYPRLQPLPWRPREFYNHQPPPPSPLGLRCDKDERLHGRRGTVATAPPPVLDWALLWREFRRLAGYACAGHRIASKTVARGVSPRRDGL